MFLSVLNKIWFSIVKGKILIFLDLHQSASNRILIRYYNTFGKKRLGIHMSITIVNHPMITSEWWYSGTPNRMDSYCDRWSRNGPQLFNFNFNGFLRDDSTQNSNDIQGNRKTEFLQFSWICLFAFGALCYINHTSIRTRLIIVSAKDPFPGINNCIELLVGHRLRGKRC